MGIRAWTEADEAALRAGYGRVATRELARSLDRSRWAIRKRASRMGLEGARSGRWTEAEDRVLHAEYRRVRCSVLAARLGRSRAAVTARAGLLGLNRSHRGADPATLEEVRRLHAEGLNDREIARRMGAARGSVMHWRHVKLGLAAVPPKRRSDPETTEAVRRLHAEGLADPEIAARMAAPLGRATYFRRVVLGLPANRPASGHRSGWTEWEEALLRHEYGRGTTAKDLARRLGRTTPAVFERAGKLGLRRPLPPRRAS